jgi:hypothetical protein
VKKIQCERVPSSNTTLDKLGKKKGCGGQWVIAKNVKRFALVTMCTIMSFIANSTVAEVVVACKAA